MTNPAKGTACFSVWTILFSVSTIVAPDRRHLVLLPRPLSTILLVSAGLTLIKAAHTAIAGPALLVTAAWF